MPLLCDVMTGWRMNTKKYAHDKGGWPFDAATAARWLAGCFRFDWSKGARYCIVLHQTDLFGNICLCNNHIPRAKKPCENSYTRRHCDHPYLSGVNPAHAPIPRAPGLRTVFPPLRPRSCSTIDHGNDADMVYGNATAMLEAVIVRCAPLWQYVMLRLGSYINHGAGN